MVGLDCLTVCVNDRNVLSVHLVSFSVYSNDMNIIYRVYLQLPLVILVVCMCA